MILTTGQTTLFFEDAEQMAMPHEAVLQLTHEGLDTVDDLVEFDKVSIQHIASSLRRLGGRIPDTTPRTVYRSTIPIPPFKFGAKYQIRMEVACNLVCFYETLGRPLTAENLK